MGRMAVFQHDLALAEKPLTELDKLLICSGGAKKQEAALDLSKECTESRTPWIAGSSFGIADALIFPMVWRLSLKFSLMLDGK